MKVLDSGHLYELHELDVPNEVGVHQLQFLRFVKRQGLGYPGNTSSYYGTTIQDVLRCCIERLNYVNNQIPNQHTEEATEFLRCAFRALEIRAAERHGRPDAIWDFPELEPFCQKCGHLGCNETCRRSI